MLTGNIVLSSIYRAAIECSIGDLRCVEKTRSCGEVSNRTTSLSLSRDRPRPGDRPAGFRLGLDKLPNDYLPLLFTKELSL